MSPPNWGRLRGGTDNVKSGLHPTLALPSMGRETVFVGLKPNLFTIYFEHPILTCFKYTFFPKKEKLDIVDIIYKLTLNHIKGQK